MRPKLCNTAYIDDATVQRSAVEEFGLAYLGRYENVDHQAFLCSRGERTILAVSGTRFSDGNVCELLDDEDVLPVDLSNGAHVMQGFYAGLSGLFSWALSAAPRGHLFDITGHSLGGARAHLAPLFVPAGSFNRLYSFAAPKAANAVYWKAFAAPLTRVVNERDLWVGWPFIGEWCQPETMLWLHDRIVEQSTESKWPGGLRASDHSIDGGYIPALTALAAQKPIAA